MPDKIRLLELALKGLQAERAKIEDEIAQVKSQLGPANTTARLTAVNSGAASLRKRRKMSAAARKRISEGMKRRYAELRKAGKIPA